jgi:hypothetical protein
MRWYLVLVGVAIGHGFEPHSDLELLSTKYYVINSAVDNFQVDEYNHDLIISIPSSTYNLVLELMSYF